MEPFITGNADVESFFEDAVRDAALGRGYDPDAPSALYLSGVLASYVRPERIPRETLERPLTLVLADALQTAGAERFRRLRGLGDHVLYVSGFFAEHIESRGLAPTFVRGLGKTAYDAAGAMLRRVGGEARGPDVFDELASNFDELAAVLTDVADALRAASARDPRSVLDLYERWVRRGSNALAEALARAGVVPTRGNGTVH
ncbi:MAG TPA: hypothetical protein VHU80_23765 [Polyangiaceae bacterium]|jgi:hypothetical protein|nr:hypothetical protein [Polyangiaceae bacterium]